MDQLPFKTIMQMVDVSTTIELASDSVLYHDQGSKYNERVDTSTSSGFWASGKQAWR